MTPFSYYDLVEAFGSSGCAVCNLLKRDVSRYLDGMLYELVLDPDIQAAFRAERGLCNGHSWQLKQYIGNSLGIAILYAAALDEVLRIVEQTPVENGAQSRLERLFGSGSTSPGTPLAEKLEPAEPCLACTLLARNEKVYVETIAERITDSRLQQAYRSSSGLCLPHFRQVIRQPMPSDQAQLIVSIQKTIWVAFRGELDEFMRKCDFQHAGERMGPEGDSWSRAIARLSGEKGIFGVRPRTP